VNYRIVLWFRSLDYGLHFLDGNMRIPHLPTVNNLSLRYHHEHDSIWLPPQNRISSLHVRRSNPCIRAALGLRPPPAFDFLDCEWQQGCFEDTTLSARSNAARGFAEDSIGHMFRDIHALACWVARGRFDVKRRRFARSSLQLLKGIAPRFIGVKSLNRRRWPGIK
jgi:hypothetical protein